MKILFPFVGDSVGGSHISTLELYLSLIDRGISAVIVLHIDDGPLSKYLQRKNISFYILKPATLAGTTPGKISILNGIFSNFFRFGSFIKKNKIDIVHGNDLRINLSWSIPSKVFSKGFVWHQRTLLSSSKFWLLIRYLCSYFVAISDVVMKNSPKNLPNMKRGVIYNPFSVTPFLEKDVVKSHTYKKYNIPSNCFLFGYSGRIVEYKKIDFIIRNIYDIYHNVNKNVYLIIVGTGPEEYVDKLKEYVVKLGLDKRVIFTGFLTNPNKVVASLNLLIASSLVEAFGRNIVEAMLLKTPVLASKSGGHLDIISNGNNGTFYDSDIEGDFIDKASTIMYDKNIVDLTDKAYTFAKKKFSSKHHLDKMLEIYYDFLNKK